MEHTLFICACQNTAHQLIFTRFIEDEIEEEIYLNVGFCANKPWWKRIWIGLKYVCSFSVTPYHVEVLLNATEQQKLKELLDKHIAEYEEVKQNRLVLRQQK